MKKNIRIMVIGSAFIATAISVLAGAVTQTTTAINKDLPPSVRMKKINDCASDMSTTDLPAIIAELNRISTGGVANVEAGATGVLVVTTNITKQTVSLTDTNGVTALVVTNVTPQTFTIRFVSGVATNAP